MRENPEHNPAFLAERFPELANSKEVRDAARRTEQRTEEPISDTRESRIQNYLNRFQEILRHTNPDARQRGITALKTVLNNRYVVRVEDIPDSYWQAQLRVVRARGESGDWQDLPPEEQMRIKKEHLAQVKEDQKGSLEEWIDYLASEQSSYLPDYLKYWAFRGMLRLEHYEQGDPARGIASRFPKRPTGKQRSSKRFPEVNDRALRFIAGAYTAEAQGKDIEFRYDMSEQARSQFRDSLAKKDFRALYSWGQEYLPPISSEEMVTTEGTWVMYAQDTDPEQLTATLRGKGSGWCIAGKQLAQEYLESGNLHIYYTYDRYGNATVPRVVIVEKGDRITEVRGIAWEENVDAAIEQSSIISDKLAELPGGGSFVETDRDMKLLTVIDGKMSAGTPLLRDELAFLYELERPIRYFGLKEDPRVAELRAKRNPEADMSILFDCTSEQIAHTPADITADTKAFVGPLKSGIFDRIQEYGVEHVYTSFPEGRILLQTLELGGESVKALEHKLEQANIEITNYARDMLRKMKTLSRSEEGRFARLTVRDLGFPHGTTTRELYERAAALGLDLCPAETGPRMRLSDTEQALGEWYDIGMEPITDRDGHPRVFSVGRYGGGRWLDRRWTHPGIHWDPEGTIVFRLRKLTT